MGFQNLPSLVQRLVGVAVLLPLAFGFAVSPQLAGWLVVVVAMMMAYELGTMLKSTKPRRLVTVAAIGVICLVAGEMIPVSPNQNPLFQILFLILMFTLLMSRRGGVLGTVFAVVLATSMAATSALVAMPSGTRIVLALVLIIAACDISAYFVGRHLGGPKLAPSISPNKTISGAVGGVFGGVILAVGCANLLGMTIIEAVIGGICVSVLAQMGDLLESSLKRIVGVKDSGSIIPGHGGALDRFDGYLLTLPAAYLYFL